MRWIHLSPNCLPTGLPTTALSPNGSIRRSMKSLRIAMRSGILFPLMLWLSLALGLLTWPGIGQLTANALLGILIAFALASLKYPNVEFFVRKPLRR